MSATLLDFLGGVRLSEEKDDEALQADAIARQKEDVEKVAARKGGRIVGWYIEPDISGFKDVYRPEWERLLRDLPNSDGFIAYDMDRVTRRPPQLERLIAVYEAKPSLVFGQVAGELDLGTNDGRFMARILVNVGNKSSADTARRVARRHEQVRARGVNPFGGRPFGWGTNKVALDEGEAALIGKAAEQILTGVGLHTIAREWNEAGVLTARGNTWQGSTLRTMMLSPRLAGYRVHNPRINGKRVSTLPEIALDDNGLPIMGKYDPVLDVEQWEAVKAVLVDPARCVTNQGGVKRRYLLSGIVRCGVCGGGMVGATDKRHENYHRYACPSKTSGGCGAVAIHGGHVEALVVEALLTHWRDGQVEHPVESFNGDGEIARLEALKAETMASFEAGDLPGADAFPTVKRTEAKLKALRKERTAWVKAQAKAGLAPVDLVSEFGDYDLDRKRVAISNSKLAAVVVKRPTKRGRSFDPSRVVIEWER